MIAIIDGKRYNTDTATKIGCEGKGYASDFHHWEEILYLTKKGAWFIEYSGGALSCYATAGFDQNSSCGSEGIKSLTNSEAEAWLERYEYVDMLEKYFAENITDA